MEDGRNAWFTLLWLATHHAVTRRRWLLLHSGCSCYMLHPAEASLHSASCQQQQRWSIGWWPSTIQYSSVGGGLMGGWGQFRWDSWCMQQDAGTGQAHTILMLPIYRGWLQWRMECLHGGGQRRNTAPLGTSRLQTACTSWDTYKKKALLLLLALHARVASCCRITVVRNLQLASCWL